MKKIFISMIFCVMAIAASAQVETLDIKANLRGELGLGIGLTADIGNDFEFSPSLNYEFWDCGTHLDVEGDFHYNVDLGKKFTFYPVFGLLLHYRAFDDDHWHDPHHHHHDYDGHYDCCNEKLRLGVDLGVGFKYDFSRKCAGFIEGKYQYVKHNSDSYFSMGVKIAI